MAKIYTKNTWVDEVLAGAERYNTLTNAGAPIDSNIQIVLNTGVSVAGSGVTAARMNNLEDGVDALDTEIDTRIRSKLGANIISPTTANVTAAANTFPYFADISGLTANRNFIIPAGAVGDEILLNITTGDDLYALIIIGATGVTINGGSAATEWSRLFITNESIRLVATSATNWQIVHDGRLPCISVFERTTSAANTTHSADTDTKADWNSLPKNTGSCGDTTNDRFTVRRAGTYEARGSYAPAAAITDQKFVNVKVIKNATARVVSASQRQSAATASSIVGVAIAPKPVDLAVGDYLEYFFNTEEADRGLLNTDFAGGGANQLGTVTFFAVREMLR